MNIDNPDKIAKAWLQAGRELGVEVVAPFSLRSPAGEVVEYIALVRNFGTDKGMLLLADFGAKGSMQLAQAEGFSFSCLSESYAEFDRQRFIDALNDWGWTGSDKQAPNWYTGEPWTSEPAL
ncbi:MAG: hypothetical protein WCL49_08775 [bacterium]